jgi:NADH:ubiquinone oxidoreductase subunit K
VALAVGLSALATGHAAAGLVAVILAAAAAAIGVAWLIHTHRRVRDAELQWYAIHSDNPAPPPSS